MGRALAQLAFGLVLCGAAGGLAVYFSGWSPWDRRRQRKIDRREIVLDEEIQQNARDNYRHQERGVRLVQRILDADAQVPFLSIAHRAELQLWMSEFYEKEPKGNG